MSSPLCILFFCEKHTKSALFRVVLIPIQISSHFENFYQKYRTSLPSDPATTTASLRKKEIIINNNTT
jgi:hypothetical protein